MKKQSIMSLHLMRSATVFMPLLGKNSLENHWRWSATLTRQSIADLKEASTNGQHELPCVISTIRWTCSVNTNFMARLIKKHSKKICKSYTIVVRNNTLMTDVFCSCANGKISNRKPHVSLTVLSSRPIRIGSLDVHHACQNITTVSKVLIPPWKDSRPNIEDNRWKCFWKLPWL